jgi:hypothetical protein
MILNIFATLTFILAETLCFRSSPQGGQVKMAQWQSDVDRVTF